MKIAITIVFLTVQVFLYGQKISITFNPVFGSLPLKTGKWFHYKNDSIKISTLKFYVTNTQFYQDGSPVTIGVSKYQLVDIANPSSLMLQTTGKSHQRFNRISFCLGVDSPTNMLGVQAGDLDPTNGMYWAWQSGYINFKLEGQSKLCSSRNNEFIFHIGGYQYPNNTLQNISFQTGRGNNIVIDVDILQLVNQLQLDTLFHIMSPGSKAVDMAQKISTIFKVRT